MENSSQVNLVKDLRNPDFSWNLNHLNSIFPVHIVNQITFIHLSDLPDVIDLDKSTVSSKSIYESILKKEDLQPSKPLNSYLIKKSSWRNLWKLPFPSKIKFFLWRLLLNRLPTLDNLEKKTILDTPLDCCFCINNKENYNHLFLSCPLLLLSGKSLLTAPRILRLSRPYNPELIKNEKTII